MRIYEKRSFNIANLLLSLVIQQNPKYLDQQSGHWIRTFFYLLWEINRKNSNDGFNISKYTYRALLVYFVKTIVLYMKKSSPLNGVR